MSLAVLSTSASKEKRKLMEFSDKWGDGPVFNWYRALKVSSTTVTHLEIRINDGTPPHRFVLVYLENGPVFCFERHPETAKPGTLVLETLGGLSTRKAADNYSELNQENLEDLKTSTHCELDLTTPPNTDLLHVISACFALSQDEEARDYALLKYNCYFFSWTLVMIVARHTLPFVMPSPDEVTERAAPALKNLTESVTDKMINVLLSLVLHTITGFRARLGRGIIGGLRKRGAVVWALPTCAVRFVLRQALRYQLSKGIRDQLRRKAQGQLEDSLKRILQGLLGQRDAAGTIIEVDKWLWIDELTRNFRPLVTEQLLKIFWNVILDIISFTTIAPNMDRTEVSHTPDDPPGRTIRVKRRLIGDFQFVRMWNDALNAALPAARQAAYDKANPSMFANNRAMHSEIFNIAFNAASGAALEAAKKAAEDTKEQMNNPKREAMWEKFWKVWSDVWEASKKQAEETVVQLFEDIVEDIVQLVVNHVVDVVGNNQKQQLVALISEYKSQKSESTKLSIADFQNKILKSVRTAYFQTSEPYITSIQQAMSRAWLISRIKYGPINANATGGEIQIAGISS